MTDTLLIVADVLLFICAWMLVADFIQKRHRMLQSHWFKIRRKVFGK